ncbi:MAG: HD domain-containing protein [Anaerolineae bacterium]|nr:HD domain-containing protein [Anaerolineae bacterium]MDW8102189.1 HD domain-containing protein [Anaerolineae bacterium]
MAFDVPVKQNEKLRKVLERVNQDQELRQWWKSANINAIDRQGMSDHGEVHIRIVANAALKILRLLMEAGIKPSAELNHGLTGEDAEVITLLGACLHDVGMAIHRREHELFSVALGYPKARQLLEGIYTEPTITIMACEILHAVIAHRWDMPCLTIEAGVVKVADALDMTGGRSRIPFEAGKVNIYSVSALAVDAVKIERGDERPVRIEIIMNNSAGIFQVDELLKRKLQNSSIYPYVEVVAKIEGVAERRIMEVYRL